MSDVKYDERDLQIDEYALEKEWIRQPKLRHAYGLRLADAQRELDQARADLGLAKSLLEKTAGRLSKEIAADPELYGLKKTTDPAIAGAVKVHDDYEEQEEAVDEANRKVIEAAHLVRVLEGVVAALSDKRKALEGLVSLFLADYYGKPRAPKGKEEEVRNMIDDSTRERQRRAKAKKRRRSE
jgi:hypothetical protein